MKRTSILIALSLSIFASIALASSELPPSRNLGESLEVIREDNRVLRACSWEYTKLRDYPRFPISASDRSRGLKGISRDGCYWLRELLDEAPLTRKFRDALKPGDLEPRAVRELDRILSIVEKQLATKHAERCASGQELDTYSLDPATLDVEELSEKVLRAWARAQKRR